MTSWTQGYVEDIDYTYGYYDELNPLWRNLPLLNAGFAIPEVRTACELGFGHGVSTNIHAAATNTTWYGTDFNPVQAAYAKELLKASGAEAHLYDESFDVFCKRADLPEFDYIALHGIWSWVSNDNREIIVDFIKRKLKVGGVLYISYNTQPGRAAMVPMRDLLMTHVQVMGASCDGMSTQIDNALNFAEALLNVEPKFARMHPEIKKRIQLMQGQGRDYLAHEYFNSQWDPISFSDMADCLKPAKLQYVCSANYLDAIDSLNLTKEQQIFLRNLSDPIFHQATRDFCVNKLFRQDYWIKGARKIPLLELEENLRAQRIVLIKPLNDVKLEVSGSLGKAKMDAAIYGPILDAIEGHLVTTLGELETKLSTTNGGVAVSFVQLVQAILVLASVGAISYAQDPKVVDAQKIKTDKLNRHLMHKARSVGDVSVLASPVTGAGIDVDRLSQIFLLARTEGWQRPDQWAAFAWKLISAQGQNVVQEGRALKTDSEGMSYLTERANYFAENQLPLLEALQVL